MKRIVSYRLLAGCTQETIHMPGLLECIDHFLLKHNNIIIIFTYTLPAESLGSPKMHLFDQNYSKRLIHVTQSWIFSITPVFSVTWSFRNHYNLLLKKHLLLLLMLKTLLFSCCLLSYLVSWHLHTWVHFLARHEICPNNYILLQFPKETNTRGSETLTPFTPFHTHLQSFD